MKVLFLEIDTEREWAVASIGPAYLAAYLRQQGHAVEMLRVGRDDSIDAIADQVRQREPRLLALSLTTRQWLPARAAVGALRRQIDIPVVAGGLHPTFAPEDVLASPGFDFVCLGEGELALADLVAALEDGQSHPTEILNVGTRDNPRPQVRPAFEPIDDLPFMARDLLDERYGVVHMTTQRGCPFPCTYCGANRYHDLYGRASAYGRRRSHENVIAELEHVRRTGQLNYVIFLDDTFTIYPSWVADFCRIYAQRLRVPFSIHARADTVDRAMVDQLAAAGCRHIVYGVESGSPRVRHEIMKRGMTNGQMVETFAYTRAAGILVTANYMLGLPGETPADLEQTLALHERLQPDDFGYFVFYPYPGTQLFHVCRDRGYLPEDYLQRPANHRESILKLPDLTNEQIAAAYDRFTAIRERERQVKSAAADQAAAAAASQEVQRCAAVG